MFHPSILSFLVGSTVEIVFNAIVFVDRNSMKAYNMFEILVHESATYGMQVLLGYLV